MVSNIWDAPNHTNVHKNMRLWDTVHPLARRGSAAIIIENKKHYEQSKYQTEPV